MSPPCFNGSLEWTNQKLDVERAFCVFHLFCSNHGGEGEMICVQLDDLQPQQ